MKKENKTIKQKTTKAKIDPSLDRYLEMNPFPEKLAKANEMLKNAKLPVIKKD